MILLMAVVDFVLAAFRNDVGFRIVMLGGPRISVMILIGQLAGTSTAVGRYTIFTK
jgi:hypothetical protein